MRYRIVIFSLLAVVLILQNSACAKMKVLKSGDNYNVAAELVPDAKKALEGKLIIAIERKGEWKVTYEAPMRVTLTPPDGFAVPNKLLKNKDLVKKDHSQVKFEVPYKAAAKGELSLKIKFNFVLCTKTLCQKKRFEVDFPISL